MSCPAFNWIDHYPAAVSVCDDQGIIIAMNEMAAHNFASQGGKALIGSSLFDCHPESANLIIRRLLREQGGNTYFVEKKGQRKLVSQQPWYHEGRFCGLVETIILVPPQTPLIRRD